ncbi:hypothetical protein D3C81_1732460 [compost metagenome]
MFLSSRIKGAVLTEDFPHLPRRYQPLFVATYRLKLSDARGKHFVLSFSAFQIPENQCRLQGLNDFSRLGRRIILIAK